MKTVHEMTLLRASLVAVAIAGLGACGLLNGLDGRFRSPVYADGPSHAVEGEGEEGEGEEGGTGEGGEGEGGPACSNNRDCNEGLVCESGSCVGAVGLASCDIETVCHCTDTEGTRCGCEDGSCFCLAGAELSCVVEPVALEDQLGCRGDGCSFLGGEASCGNEETCDYTCGSAFDRCLDHGVNLACIPNPDGTTVGVCAEPTPTCFAAVALGEPGRPPGGPLLQVLGLDAALADANCVEVTAEAFATGADLDADNLGIQWAVAPDVSPRSSIFDLTSNVAPRRALFSFDICGDPAITDVSDVAVTVVDADGVRSNIACRPE